MSRKNTTRNAHADLGKEVTALARQVMAVIQDPVVRSEVKGIGKEALHGLRATGHRIAKALHKAKESEAARDIASQAKQVYGVGQRQGKKTAHRVSAEMVNRLRKVGDELQQLSNKLRKKHRSS